MRIIDSRFYRWMDTATNFFLLTILWLVASLPVITVFTATTAMYGVFRAWEENDSAGIIGPFFASFRRRFLQSLLVGVVWAILGVILVVDIIATRGMTTPVALPLFIATLSLSLFYTMLTIYIYPILANARTTVLGVIRNAFLLALSQPLLSLLATFGLLVLGIGLWIFPAAIIVVGSPVAYGLNALFNRAVRRFPSAAPLDAAAEKEDSSADEIDADTDR